MAEIQSREPIDLTLLPKVVYASFDVAEVQTDILNAYSRITGRTLQAGDPVRLFLNTIAYVVVMTRAAIQYAGEQSVLSTARGAALDALGALLNVPRLDPKPSSAAGTFSIPAALPFAVAIPQGTRVTSDGNIIFETLEYVEIAAGTTSVNATIQAQEAGENGNGFVAGQINQLVDSLSGNPNFVNTETTAGGADTEADDPYRLRIQLAPETMSVAGPILAYMFYAKSAHQDIADVAVLSPTPGVVDLRVLMTGGKLPTQAILDAVLATCSADDVRPLTDNVSAAAPIVKTFDTYVQWFVARSNIALVASITAAVNQAVADYQEWQINQIGKDIIPDELTRRIMEAGAKRVVISSPTFTVVADNEVPQVGTTAIIYGGIEND